MPIQEEWSDRGIHWTFSGIVTKDEMTNSIISHFYNDERSMSVAYQILDTSSAEEIQITHQDLVFFAGTDVGRSRHLLNLKFAFVVTDQKKLELVNVYINTFKRANKSWEFKIFDNICDASAWAKS